MLSALRTNSSMLILMFVLAAACVASALLIVHNQYQVRTLITNIERGQEESRRLQDEARELSIEFTKVSLPRYIASKAAEMGLEVGRTENSVILKPKPVPRFVTRDAKDKGEQS